MSGGMLWAKPYVRQASGSRRNVVTITADGCRLLSDLDRPPP
ncbi:hypothetical protein [Nonomuraea sp. WAC 01424]|nr:hypothetical protein [Nonomuraea sp. WAC 01424]